jgi:UDP:flavonoid glycosyltransferase YjiC (YdhE family)
MSRFVFATFGSLGDLHPYIAVASALNRHGHAAVIAASEEYREAVTGAGVEFAPVRPGMSELGDYRTLVTRVLDVRSGPEYLIRQLIMPHLRSAYEDQLRASQSADLLISHPLAFTLPLVAQRRALPWVSTVLSPMSFMSSFDPPVIPVAPWLQILRVFGAAPYRLLFGLLKRLGKSWEAPLRAFRQELGLPSSNQAALFEGQFSPLGNLALFDPPLAQPQPDWPARTLVCGSPVYDGAARDLTLLRELETFLALGDPPIVFALGSSAVWVAGNFWEHAIAAAQQIGRRAILITGPATPTSLPDGIRAFSYLPYSVVFPRAAAIVNQAGIGTLAQALRSGCPQLLVPLAFDQPDNAKRAQSLGLGRVIRFRQVTEGLLARELEALLARPQYGKAARALASELAKIDGATCAANELIACVRSPTSENACL